MTSPVTTASSTSTVAEPAGANQAALVWRHFRRRRLAVAGAAVIVALVQISVFAPFLANDRPWTYVGENRFEYQEAIRTLRTVVGRLPESAAKSPAALNDDLATIRRQTAVMVASLTFDHAAALRTWESELLSTARSNPPQAAGLRSQLRDRFAETKVAFRPIRHWPVPASLDSLSVGLMLASTLLLVEFIRRGIGGRWAPRSGLGPLILRGLVPPLVAIAVWSAWNPPRVDRTPYKLGIWRQELTADAKSPPVVFDSSFWPPVPYALDEGNLDRKEWKPAITGQGPRNGFSRWDAPHWLGTDSIGRDILCRMIWGGRVSLSVGIVAVGIYVVLGVVIGAAAGYFRGWTDLLISRLIEIVICFPSFFLILTIVAFVGPSMQNIMIVIGLTGWTGIARLVRGEFLRLVDLEFVQAARALGYSSTRIIFRHILPNALAPVLVSATFGVAGAILTESGLSFLGVGITVPTPSWGSILASGRDAIFRAPWLIVTPGLAIFLTITSYNLVGEALRDATDPRLTGSR